MLNIALSSSAAAKLYSILKEEDDNACVRVREFKVSTSCNMNLKIVLGLSIDEHDEDDVEGEAETLLFVMNRELVEQYGSNFSVALDPHRVFEVLPVRADGSLRSRPRQSDERIIWPASIMLA